MRACWMPPRSPAAKLDPLRLSALHRRPLRRALFICARVRRPAPSRRVMALTVLGSPCVISREGPVGRLTCSRHRQQAIPCTRVPGTAFGRAYRAVCAVSMAACGIPSGDRRGHLLFGRCTGSPVKARSAVCLRPVAGIFLECLEERLNWVGIWALWAKPRRSGVPGKDKGSGVLSGKANGAQQMTG